ncbi:DUF1223 domain-containing protein [Mucilaginibacter psychrotolerans]|uniref:DUF1223 domain-containing protein n=1 Tax=Mucilaginibacter psychrotolerans TaxID=1524096 RepID=A0A4Y8SDK0_9SPHI|nr:DUF1223 domain-containing protein [Mucilaginibacter psychrotolerans]TFF36534.1 DUF1223 domain-containing protein [Mucilaginibacter psychrotolerans]
MKTIKILSTAGLLLAVAFASVAFISTKPASTKAQPLADNKGFAVVELFTSEGCSSCPPADAAIAKIEKESVGKPVYILAYHVDYWNRLGWKDAFSSAEFSHRQSVYAHWLNISQVYTPQAVVNGHTEFVGSEEGKLRNAINTGLAKTAKTSLSLEDLKIAGGKASVKYRTEGSGANTALVLALVEKNATTAVKAGENSGRTLAHVQIVVKLQQIALKGDKSGAADIELPKNFNAQNFEVIAFVQNTQNGGILAAQRAAFPEMMSASN